MELDIYKLMFEESNDIIILFEPDGNIVEVNKMAENVYGYSREELIGMNIYDLRKPHSGEFIRSQLQVASSNGITFQTVHYTKEGLPLYVEVKSKGIEHNGQMYLVSIIRELLSRTKFDEKMRLYTSLVEYANDAIISVDIDGTVTGWNNGAEKLYGYKKEEIIGNSIFIIQPDGSDDVKKLLEVVKRGKTLDNYETVRKNKDGINIYVSISMSPIYDSNGDISGMSTIARDVSESRSQQKELFERYQELTAVYEELTATEEELRDNCEKLEKAKEEAEKATIAKSQFLANMSHEIRTPMNGIMGVVQLLELTNINSEQKSYLTMLKDSSYLLLEIINSVLDISKIEAGKLKLNNAKFNFRDTINRIIGELSITAVKKGIEVMYYIDPFIPNDFIGDEVRLNQILINLVNNAVKFTDKGYIFLKVKKLKQDEKMMKLEFSVEDTGVGISDEFRSKIFKIFNQEDISFSKKYGGTGLGLAISKQLVEMMGGEIWYESQQGKGTNFHFTAEFKYEEEAVKEPISEDMKKAEDRDKLILIAEDNDINMRIAKGFVKAMGYRSIEACNGKEALEAVGKNSVDLILMDIQMPELSGIEATIEIRKEEKSKERRIPIVAMTAYAMSGDREKLIEAGIDDYISKPFGFDEFSKIIKNKIG